MILEIQSIKLKRNRRLLFNDFNLKLNKSQIMILLGDNGSGKSSLMDAIAGLIKPEKGSIKVNNTRIEEMDSLKRIFFTYLPHKDSLKDNLTVKENLEIWLNLSKASHRNINFEKGLEFFNLKNLQFTLVRNLSEGQRKKVSLTKLLFSKSSLWLLDEPFNNLDKRSTIKFKKLVKKKTLLGGAVLMSSHVDFKINKCLIKDLNKNMEKLRQKDLNLNNWNKL